MQNLQNLKRIGSKLQKLNTWVNQLSRNEKWHSSVPQMVLGILYLSQTIWMLSNMLGRHGKKFVTNLRPDHSMDKSNLIVVLKLPIRNIKAVRTLSIPPYICLFDLMKMSEKSNTSAPFQLFQIHPQCKGHKDFQQNHANQFEVIKIVWNITKLYYPVLDKF